MPLSSASNSSIFNNCKFPCIYIERLISFTKFHGKYIQNSQQQTYRNNMNRYIEMNISVIKTISLSKHPINHSCTKLWSSTAAYHISRYFRPFNIYSEFYCFCCRLIWYSYNRLCFLSNLFYFYAVIRDRLSAIILLIYHYKNNFFQSIRG